MRRLRSAGAARVKQVLSASLADAKRKEDRGGRGENAEFHFRLPEPRVRRDEKEMGCESKFQSPAEALTAHGDEDGLAECQHRVEQPMEALQHLLAVLRQMLLHTC